MPVCKKLNITVLAQLEPSLIDWLRTTHNTHTWCNPGDPPPYTFLEHAEIIIYRTPYQLTENMIAACPKLRWIIRAGSGIDDVKRAVNGRNINISITPEASQSAAEQALALMFAAARQIPQNHQSLLQGSWCKAESVGIELFSECFLIIGFGRIGQRIANMLSAIAGEILICDPSLEKPEKQQALAGLNNAKPVDLKTGIQQAQIIFLSCSNKTNTSPLLQEKHFKLMQKNCILVNIGRGALIDEQSLITHLSNHHIRAGLDTFIHEPRPSAALLNCPNLVVSPHVGAQTLTAHEKISLKVKELIENHEHYTSYADL